MGPDLQTSGTPLRCPSCTASVRPDAPWCGQCYADLRPPAAAVSLAAPPPVTAPAAPVTPSAAPSLSPAAPTAAAPSLSPAAPTADVASLTPLVPVAGGASAATWPCGTCGTPNGIDRDACASCGAGFLAALRAAEEPLLVLPVVGDVAALSRAQRLGLAAAVVLAVVLLTLLLGLLLS